MPDIKSQIFRVEIYYINPQIKIHSGINPELFRYGRPRLFDTRYIMLHAGREKSQVKKFNQALQKFTRNWRCKYKNGQPFKNKIFKIWPDQLCVSRSEQPLIRKMMSDPDTILIWAMTNQEQNWNSGWNSVKFFNLIHFTNGIFECFEEGHNQTTLRVQLDEKRAYAVMLAGMGEEDKISDNAIASMHTQNPKYWINYE